MGVAVCGCIRPISRKPLRNKAHEALNAPDMAHGCERGGGLAFDVYSKSQVQVCRIAACVSQRGTVLKVSA